MGRSWIVVTLISLLFIGIDIWATAQNEQVKELTHIWMPPAVIMAILIALRGDIKDLNKRINEHLEGHP